MELSIYITPLRKWWWLLVAATLVAGISSFIASLQQPPVYQAKTTLIIGRIIDVPNPSQGEFSLAQQLASTYAEIANREPVREATKQALGVNGLPPYLASAIPNSQLIEIAVTDTNPLRAQVVANELANQLILRSPTSTRPEDQERQEFIEQQLNDLQVQIVDTQDEIAKRQEELGNLNSARQLADTQTQINALQSKLSTLQSNYAALLANTQQGATNTLTVVEPAGLPATPVGPQKGMSIFLSAMIGFSLAAGAAYLLEYLDNTLKTPEEIKRTLGLPIIGFIGDVGDSADDEAGVYVSKNPRSPIAEAYRSLRANIEFTSVDEPVKSILIAGADMGAGKTSVAANLATIIAQSEKRVVLMDADLRKSSIHELAGLPNNIGLSDIFRNGLAVSDVIQVWKDEKVGVITGGTAPPNPAELLGSKKMDKILARLEEIVDLVIIDSPPFVVSDALLLASKVDGVLLVIRPGHTKKKFAMAMMEQLNRSGARILGVVMNRIPRGSAEYYGGYLYYAPNYTNGHYNSEDEVTEGKKAGRSMKRGDSERNLNPEINKYLQPVTKPGTFKTLTARFQEKVKSAIRERRTQTDSPSVYLEDLEQDDHLSADWD